MSSTSIIPPRPDLKALEPEALPRHLAPDLATCDADALLAHFRSRWADRPGAFEPDADRVVEAKHLLDNRFTTRSRGLVAFPTPMIWARYPGTKSAPTEIVRFRWAPALAHGWQAAGDERYVLKFIELADHFFEHHPVTNADFNCDVPGHPNRWSWMDLQTVRRAQAILSVLPLMVHADVFGAPFLVRTLARLYDHAQLLALYPKLEIAHNMAMSEHNGLSELGESLPEFAEAPKWIALATGRMGESLLAQTTPDGVQTEWTPSYHLNVCNSASQVLMRMRRSNQAIASAIMDRYRAMIEHAWAIATPRSLDVPAFGDSKREVPDSSADPPARGGCVGHLRQAAELIDEPKYAALIDRRFDDLPDQSLFAFAHAGIFVFRSDWTDDQTYLAVHNVPGPTTWHDEPDNATFELRAMGRWLMNDTGYLSYGEDRERRAAHRRTDMHQTMTLDRRDASVAGRTIAHQSAPGVDKLVIENDSYEDLVHRRTIWFIDRSWFLLLDEAVGHAEGEVSLHFQFAPGGLKVDEQSGKVWTTFDDVNLLMTTIAPTTPTFHKEAGWYAHGYRERVPRPALRITSAENAPTWFLTSLVPYRGVAPPKAVITREDDVIRACINDKDHEIHID